MRENCQQILIVVADYHTGGGVPAWPEAAQLRALGVNIFGLGTGNTNALERELALIVSGNDYFFDLNTFDNLNATANIDKIENTICGKYWVIGHLQIDFYRFYTFLNELFLFDVEKDHSLLPL